MHVLHPPPGVPADHLSVHRRHSHLRSKDQVRTGGRSGRAIRKPRGAPFRMGACPRRQQDPVPDQPLGRDGVGKEDPAGGRKGTDRRADLRLRGEEPGPEEGGYDPQVASTVDGQGGPGVPRLVWGRQDLDPELLAAGEAPDGTYSKGRGICMGRPAPGSIRCTQAGSILPPGPPVHRLHLRSGGDPGSRHQHSGGRASSCSNWTRKADGARPDTGPCP